MEPIGTITLYFPLIDQETKSVLEGTMKDASDYYDFVQRLCDLVLNNDCPVMVVYFAIHHAILAADYKLIDRIREKYGKHQILGPNLFISSASEGKVEDLKKVRKLADAVLATRPAGWIVLEMNFMKFEADMRDYPTTTYQTSTLDRIRELIESDARLGFYETVLNDYLSIRAHADGDSNAQVRCINRGLRVARRFDDRVRIAYLLVREADVLMNSDREKCRARLKQALKIVESSLGIPVLYADVISTMAILDALRGEFDSAIKLFLQVVSIRESAGMETGNASYYLATLYNMIGEPESGLEWGFMAENQFRGRPSLMNRATLSQIWSLTLLSRVTEAEILMNTSRESILRSGDESQLAWLHFVTGILELEQGDSTSASSSIGEGLRIYERKGLALIMELIFLLHLAKTEVYACDTEEAVSPSLAILEEKAVTEDLPGFLGQALLLRADIAVMNNDEASLREIIPRLRSLSEKESMQFLKPSFDRLLTRI